MRTLILRSDLVVLIKKGCKPLKLPENTPKTVNIKRTQIPDLKKNYVIKIE